MAKTIISVESTSDLTDEFAASLGIAYINMEYIVDGVQHKMGDGTYTISDFYKKMSEGSLTKTNQVNAYDAKEHLEKILKEGNDVIHLAFSSSLSGTYNSFVAAKEELAASYPERKIAVIDSLCAASGQGLFAVLTERYSRTHSFEETVAYAEELRHHIAHYFVVDNLKYLARGGRISKATALLGNAIHMKPVMHMDKDGKLVPYKKVISRKKSILTLAEMTARDFKGDEIYIGQAACMDEAMILSGHIEKTLGVKPSVFDLGMVIGSHSGPGTLAVFFVADKRE